MEKINSHQDANHTFFQEVLRVCAVILLFFVFESLIGTHLRIFGTYVHFGGLAVLCIAYRYGLSFGIFSAFALGLADDALRGTNLGLATLSYCVGATIAAAIGERATAKKNHSIRLSFIFSITMLIYIVAGILVNGFEPNIQRALIVLFVNTLIAFLIAPLVVFIVGKPSQIDVWDDI